MSMVASTEVLVCEGLPVGVVRFRERMEVLSSAVLNGGDRTTTVLFIMQVPKDYNDMEPRSHADRVRASLGLPEDAVGMMTAAEVDYVFNLRSSEVDGVRMEAVATAGLSNHVVAGELLEDWEERHRVSLERARIMMVGTINIAVISSVPLTMEGKVNLMIPLVEAKSAAMADHGFRETGTTSDSMAVVSPIGGDGIPYTGTGSAPGIAAARAVRSAVGHALGVRGEHPVPEDPARVLGRHGLTVAGSAGSERVLGDPRVRSLVDLFDHVSCRVDSLTADGDGTAMSMMVSILGSEFGVEPPDGRTLMDVLASVLASEAERIE